MSTVPDPGSGASPSPERRVRLRSLASKIPPLRSVALWLILAAGLLVGLATTRTPRPLDAAAPGSAFSAIRAFRHVQAIAQVPHPTGSPQAEAVRRYIFDRFADLGLQPQIRLAEAAEVRHDDPSFAAAASLQNVVGVLPGSDPKAPALLVMAHSDSVPNSAGAGDDGVGVAVLLETARSLTADRDHRRTVIFVVTDGEEVGLLGARAFFERDPLARQVGAVINMDARGDAGRTAMFQMGPRSGALLSLYGRSTEAPYANSLTALLFSILPNDTDFTVALKKGLPGLNFAFTGDQLAYHTPLATPGHLALGTLQSMGGQVLPTARAIADAESLPAGDAPAAYSDAFGRILVQLGRGGLFLVWLVSAAAAGFAGWRARKDGLLTLAEAARGMGFALLATLAAALALSAAGALLGSSFLRIYVLVARYPWLFAGCALLALATVLALLLAAARGRGRRVVAGAAAVLGLLTQFAGWNVAPLVLALICMGLGWILLDRRAGAWALWGGALLCGLLLSMLLLVAAPGAALLVLAPTLPGAVAAAAVFAAGPREGWARAALVLAAFLATIAAAWLCGWASGLFVAAGAMLPAVLAPFALLLLLGLAPFARWWAATASAPWIALGLGIAAAGVLAYVAVAPPSVGRPIPTTAAAVVEPDGSARRISAAPALDAWTRRAISGAKRETLDPVFPRPVWSTPSGRASDVRGPVLDAVRIEDRLMLHVLPTGETRRLSLWLRSPSVISDPRLDARTIPWAIKSGKWSRLDFHAPAPEGFTLSLSAPLDARIDLVAGELMEGWPKGAPPPPPIPHGFMPIGDTGTTLALTRTHIGPP